jgi:hypothetical protein
MSGETQFQPATTFSWNINRAERAQQVQFLVPLLANPEGRAWFLERLSCPCISEEARVAQPFHFVFPLRDLFSFEYDQCRGNPELEAAFIARYNQRFGLAAGFGIDTIWRTQPGGPIRHVAAPGRQGWHRAFLSQYVSDEEVGHLMTIRQWLDTEADAILLLSGHVVTIECKYRCGPAHSLRG